MGVEKIHFPRAVFVLPHHLYDDGQLSEESRGRAQLAATEFQKGGYNYLLTSGWPINPAYDQPIGEVMRDFIIAKFNIAPASVQADIRARDTVGDLYYLRWGPVERYGLGMVNIVSSDYHIHRIKKISAKLFTRDYPLSFTALETSAKCRAERAPYEAKSLNAFEAMFGDIHIGDKAAFHDRMRSEHPYYNSQVFPKI